VDLQLYARVLWRFRLLVAAGVALAILLAFFSFVKIGLHGVGYRQSEQWVSKSRIFVTQRGFPWGRLAAGPTIPVDLDKPLPPSRRAHYADEARLISLGIVLSNLAVSDPVKDLVLKRGPLHGTYEAAPTMVSPSNPEALPFVDIAATADSAEHAVDLAKRATGALKTYMVRSQVRAHIELKDRVSLSTINAAGEAKLTAGRSKTLPIVVFLTVLLAVCGICFLLENVRPRIRAVPAETETRAAA
jgi:hypothetical protein